MESYARDGLTNEEIADKINIRHSTFYDWLKRFPDISDTIKKGRQPVNAIVEKTFFEEKLKGKTVKEKTVEKTIHRDADGNITSSTEHVRETERFIPADTTAMLFYMKCRMPDKYNDKINVNVNSQVEIESNNFIEAINGTAAADWENEDDKQDEAESVQV